MLNNSPTLQEKFYFFLLPNTLVKLLSALSFPASHTLPSPRLFSWFPLPTTPSPPPPLWKYQGSRWLKRVFKCYKPFQTRKDYKKVFLSMWAIYEYLHNSFVGQYFKVSCDVIAITMTTLKTHKKLPKSQCLSIIQKIKSVTYPFYCLFKKLPKFSNFSDGIAKSCSVELKLYRKKPFFEFTKNSTE